MEIFMNKLLKFTPIISFMAFNLMANSAHTMEPEGQHGYVRNCYEHSTDSEENGQVLQQLPSILTPYFPSDEKKSLSIVSPVKLYMKNKLVEELVSLTPMATKMLIPYCIEQDRKDQFVNRLSTSATNSGRKVFYFEDRKWFMEPQFSVRLVEKGSLISRIIFENYTAQWECDQNGDYKTRVRCFYNCVFQDINEPHFVMRMTTFTSISDLDHIMDIQFNSAFNGGIGFSKAAGESTTPIFINNGPLPLFVRKEFYRSAVCG